MMEKMKVMRMSGELMIKGVIEPISVSSMVFKAYSVVTKKYYNIYVNKRFFKWGRSYEVEKYVEVDEEFIDEVMEGKWKCPICGRYFNEFELMVVHYIVNHVEKIRVRYLNEVSERNLVFQGMFDVYWGRKSKPYVFYHFCEEFVYVDVVYDIQRYIDYLVNEIVDTETMPYAMRILVEKVFGDQSEARRIEEEMNRVRKEMYRELHNMLAEKLA